MKVLLFTVSMLAATAAWADPRGIYRPNDITLFKQDLRETEKLAAIRLHEQHERENQIEHMREILTKQKHREIAQKGN